MPVYDRRNRRDLDQLVEEYITTNKINRRQFMQRATAAGLRWRTSPGRRLLFHRRAGNMERQ